MSSSRKIRKLLKLELYTKEINFLTKKLDCSFDNIADLCNWTPSFLHVINNNSKFEFKDSRLINLYNLISVIDKKFPELDHVQINNYLKNVRIITNPDDDESGSSSVINYIMAMNQTLSSKELSDILKKSRIKLIII
jgi:hypothetical protein